MSSIKKIISFVCLSVLMVSFYNCGSGNTNDSHLAFEQYPPFKVAAASYQQWVAGTPQGGGGVNVFINFSNIQAAVVFKEIYFRNKKTEVVTSSTVRVQYVGYFKNENKRPDVILDIDALKEAANTPPTKSPFQLREDEAVISYTFEDKINYFKIENLERKEPLAYPSNNPKGDN
jgi:hypothetical protein